MIEWKAAKEAEQETYDALAADSGDRYCSPPTRGNGSGGSMPARRSCAGGARDCTVDQLYSSLTDRAEGSRSRTCTGEPSA